jgi:hypothetical protein
MRPFRCGGSSLGAGLGLLFICVAGCSSSLYNWQVRTTGTPVAPSFDQTPLAERPVAIFPALSGPILRGSEVALSRHLAKILEKLIPAWKVVDEQTTLTKINSQGLGKDYIRIRRDAEDTHLLDRESLRIIGTALGVRYIFQPRLISFSQTMTLRWKVPGLELRVAETRSSMLRISLQLWDAGSGELIWSSMAESVLASEAVSQDPVFLDDAARVTLGSLMADLLNRREASQYTYLNEAIDTLVRESIPLERKDSSSETAPKEKQ